MRHRPVLVTAPEILPVTVAEFKAHLRETASDEDALIEMYLRAAVAHFDGWTGILGRCLVEQTWKIEVDAFCAEMALPLAPVIEIEDIEAGGEEVDPASYSIKTDEGGTPYLAFEAVPAGGGTITFVAGYENIAPVSPATVPTSSVPFEIKAAVQLLAAHWFKNREAVNIGNIVNEIPMSVAALIAPYRRVKF